MAKNEIPQYHELMNPLLKALHHLDGSGSIDEIYETVIENFNYSDEIVNVLHNPEESNGRDRISACLGTYIFLKIRLN